MGLRICAIVSVAGGTAPLRPSRTLPACLGDAPFVCVRGVLDDIAQAAGVHPAGKPQGRHGAPSPILCSRGRARQATTLPAQPGFQSLQERRALLLADAQPLSNGNAVDTGSISNRASMRLTASSATAAAFLPRLVTHVSGLDKLECLRSQEDSNFPTQSLEGLCQASDQ